MKKILQIPLLLVALFLTSIPISAHHFEVDGIYYNILTDSTVGVTYRGDFSTSASIPDEYTGTVTIPSSVSYNNTTYSVTSISSEAFRGCGRVNSVTIPNSVTVIGDYAFYDCTGLTSVVIPNSVTKIGYQAFYDCTSLIEVNITDLSAWCKIDFSYSYSNPFCFAKKLKLNGTEIKDLVIPNDITAIKYYAFEGCDGLTSLTIPNSVISIGGSAFKGCSSLTSVTIPNSVTSVGSSAFGGCTSLTSVTIPNSVTSIGLDAFAYCTSLSSINIPNSVTSIAAFSGCTGLTSITIPNSVISIGGFSGCTGLTSIIFPNSVTSISYNAFKGCTGLTSITLPDSVVFIGDDAFDGCICLTSLDLGNSVTSIGEGAFNGCTGLASITLPNSVTQIGKWAFSNCTGLTYVNILDLSAWCRIDFGDKGANPLYFAHKLKLNDYEIKELLIPNDITKIKDYAFSGCNGLTSLSIPNSVDSIGNDAFSGCSGLTSLSIPNSVISIGNNAFSGCSELVDCNIETTHTSATIGLSSDSNCTPYFKYNYKYYKNGEIITGLSPYTNASNWNSSSGSYSYEYGLNINGIECYISNAYFYTKQINLFIDGTAGVTYVDCSWSHTDDDATLVSEKMVVNNSSMESEDNTVRFENLDPNTSYTFDYTLKYKEFNSNFNISKTFTTGELSLTTQEAKPTSTTSVRLLAATNCDATEGTGFEWRRYDAPDELPSSKVSCPVVDGVLVGSLRGVKDDVYYKYRPYYTSSSGKTYYGDWIAFFTGDANVYFEPEVRTYNDIQVINNSATVKGYALEGTDVITAQGFEYWKTGSAITPSSTENRMIVNASGIAMSATLANLEYNSTYKYRAFVTTAQGTTYGDEVEFSTGNDPAGIDYIEIDADEMSVALRENPATGTAWVKIAGAAGEDVQYTITSMSGAVIANGTLLLDGEWNAIDLNCSAGMYLLTINDGLQVKTLRLIVK